jgi:hypothetical protein
VRDVGWASDASILLVSCFSGRHMCWSRVLYLGESASSAWELLARRRCSTLGPSRPEVGGVLIETDAGDIAHLAHHGLDVVGRNAAGTADPQGAIVRDHFGENVEDGLCS